MGVESWPDEYVTYCTQTSSPCNSVTRLFLSSQYPCARWRSTRCAVRAASSATSASRVAPNIMHARRPMLVGKPGAQRARWIGCVQVPIRESGLHGQLLVAKDHHVHIVMAAHGTAQEALDERVAARNAPRRPAGATPGRRLQEGLLIPLERADAGAALSALGDPSTSACRSKSWPHSRAASGPK